MTRRIPVTAIRVAEASPLLKEKGLIAWICCNYGELRLDGLRVRRTERGEYQLGFPTHIDGNGVPHPYYRPLDQAARDAIESQVIGDLRRRGLLPSTSHDQGNDPSRRGEALP